MRVILSGSRCCAAAIGTLYFWLHYPIRSQQLTSGGRWLRLVVPVNNIAEEMTGAPSAALRNRQSQVPPQAGGYCCPVLPKRTRSELPQYAFDSSPETS